LIEDPAPDRGCKSKDSLEMWRRATRNWLARILDFPPWPYEEQAVEMGEVDSAVVANGFVSVIRKHVRYGQAWKSTDKIPAYLFLPPGYSPENRYPAVFVQHGHPAHERPCGKDATGVQWKSAYHAVALYLAQNGFITLTSDAQTFNELGGSS